MKYVIEKEIEAATLEQAIKKESKAEIVNIYRKEEPAPPVGFKA